MKLITIAIVALLGIGLAACDPNSPTPNLIREKIIVVRPDGSFYYCPTMEQLSAAGIDRLTDRDVARIVAELHRNNMICKRSLDAIKKYLDEAARRLET